jgi:hypothetical protein
MTSNGDNTAANKIHKEKIHKEIDQLEDEVQELRIHEARAAALTEQFRAEREASEKRLAAAHADQDARERRKLFRLIIGGGAIAGILHWIRGHTVITAAAALTTLAAGTGGAIITADTPAGTHQAGPKIPHPPRPPVPATGQHHRPRPHQSTSQTPPPTAPTATSSHAHAPAPTSSASPTPRVIVALPSITIDADRTPTTTLAPAATANTPSCVVRVIVKHLLRTRLLCRG